jgi:hypothetical protein
MTESPDSFSLDLKQAAELVGAYCAIERRLFELTGSWATQSGVDPGTQVYLDSLSSQHAWHAELWADRLPVVSGIDAPALVVLPSPLEEVFDLIGAGSQLEMMAGLFRVLIPRLITSYMHHQGVASAASEPPTLRAIQLVLRDELDALVSGETLVLGLLGSPAAVLEAGESVIRLESELVKAGVFPGLVRWPGRRA